MKTTRRQVLAPAFAGLLPKSEPRIEGGFVFESQDAGHRLRDRARFAAPKERLRVPVVIVGGGIAGLSAAWRMNKRGFRDFIVLEMEAQPGGNARHGSNEITDYPWAAHYLPVPGPHSKLIRELAEEFGLLSDGKWDERWLCHSPQERLFIHGRWQEGIEPTLGMTSEDARQYERFEKQMAAFRASGAFRIPMESGLEKCGLRERALDNITMAEWMRREGFYSPYLRWYIDYSTRDDYATRADAASAWAGIHYFAAREPDDLGPLTWPEGNGWFVKKLLARVGDRVRSGQMVCSIREQGTRWHVFTEQTLYEADVVIFAAPTYLASWLLDPSPPRWPFEYAPWLVANLTLDRWPENKGLEYAWDNVIYNSPSLGYVIATHQHLTTHQPRTVWTFYWALADGQAVDQRRVLLGGDWAWWKERILADLERAHRDIRRCVSRIDIHRIGHAMPRPAPGMIFHPERLRRAKPDGRFLYANCDLSALSLFEEALDRGSAAADYALRKISSTGTR